MFSIKKVVLLILGREYRILKLHSSRIIMQDSVFICLRYLSPGSCNLGLENFKALLLFCMTIISHVNIVLFLASVQNITFK